MLHKIVFKFFVSCLSSRETNGKNKEKMRSCVAYNNNNYSNVVVLL